MRTGTLMSKSNCMGNLRGTHLLPSRAALYSQWLIVSLCLLREPLGLYSCSWGLLKRVFSLRSGTRLVSPFDLWWKCCHFLPGFPRSWDNLPPASVKYWSQEGERTKSRSLLQQVKSESPSVGVAARVHFLPLVLGRSQRQQKTDCVTFIFKGVLNYGRYGWYFDIAYKGFINFFQPIRSEKYQLWPSQNPIEFLPSSKKSL